MIPVYFKTRDFAEPAADLYYLVTATGNFLVRKTGLFRALTKTHLIPGLLEQEEALRLRLPKIPQAIMEQMYGFFVAVYEQWEGEAIVFIYYSPEHQTFHLAAPPQTLFRYKSALGSWRTEMRVEYGYCPRPPGFIKLGDAHSHGDMPAFFSCADDQDDQEDGLRITLGNLHRPEPDVRVSFVVNGRRFSLKPDDMVEDFSTPLAPPDEWLEKVSCEESHFNYKVGKASEDRVTEVPEDYLLNNDRKANEDGQETVQCENGNR